MPRLLLALAAAHCAVTGVSEPSSGPNPTGDVRSTVVADDARLRRAAPEAARRHLSERAGDSILGEIQRVSSQAISRCL